MDKSKQRLRKLSPSQVMAYAMMMLMPGAIGTLLSRSSDRALGNVVVSHIPGPREDLYWQGCRLAGLYPASLLIDMLTLNITVISRHDFVDFGLIACRKSVPHAQRLLEHLEDELAALEAGVAQRSQPKPRRRTARHART
jgi:diacylglycerol O-acyltransferase